MNEFTTPAQCEDEIRRVFKEVFSDIHEVKPDFTTQDFDKEIESLCSEMFKCGFGMDLTSLDIPDNIKNISLI